MLPVFEGLGAIFLNSIMQSQMRIVDWYPGVHNWSYNDKIYYEYVQDFLVFIDERTSQKPHNCYAIRALRDMLTLEAQLQSSG